MSHSYGAGGFWSRGDCTDLRIGDEVIQMIGGVLPRVLVVVVVRDEMLLASEHSGDLAGGTWFNRDTGLEMDLAGRGYCESFIAGRVGEL